MDLSLPLDQLGPIVPVGGPQPPLRTLSDTGKSSLGPCMADQTLKEWSPAILPMEFQNRPGMAFFQKGSLVSDHTTGSVPCLSYTLLTYLLR